MDKKVALKLHKPLFYLPLQAFENMNKKFPDFDYAPPLDKKLYFFKSFLV